MTFEVHIIFKHHLNNRKDLVSYMFLGKSEQTAIVLIAARQLVEQIRLTVPELSRADWLSLVVRTRRYKELHDMKESFWKIKANLKLGLGYVKTARYAFFSLAFLSLLIFIHKYWRNISIGTPSCVFFLVSIPFTLFIFNCKVHIFWEGSQNYDATE